MAGKTATGRKRRAARDVGNEGRGDAIDGSLNLVVVRGRVAAAPELRELEDGRTLASLAVRVRPAGGRTTWVPVTVWDPPAWVAALDGSEEVLVLGTVRRTFFAAAGGRGQRVDVEAAFVGRAGQKRARDAVRRRVEEVLVELGCPAGQPCS
jgi:hypothetical protein